MNRAPDVAEARSTATAIRSQAATESTSGFSQITWNPASRQRTICSSCIDGGVQRSITSTWCGDVGVEEVVERGDARDAPVGLTLEALGVVEFGEDGGRCTVDGEPAQEVALADPHPDDADTKFAHRCDVTARPGSALPPQFDGRARRSGQVATSRRSESSNTRALSSTNGRWWLISSITNPCIVAHSATRSSSRASRSNPAVGAAVDPTVAGVERGDERTEDLTLDLDGRPLRRSRVAGDAVGEDEVELGGMLDRPRSVRVGAGHHSLDRIEFEGCVGCRADGRGEAAETVE